MQCPRWFLAAARGGAEEPDGAIAKGVEIGTFREDLHVDELRDIALDEPTNDIDVNTMRALEEALENFAGSAVIISHDRWFLDRLATHIMAFEGDSKVVFFEGNYQDYEADRHKRLGTAADRPHRISYRKLAKG